MHKSDDNIEEIEEVPFEEQHLIDLIDNDEIVESLHLKETE
jgi:hypothetical protein